MRTSIRSMLPRLTTTASWVCSVARRADVRVAGSRSAGTSVPLTRIRRREASAPTTASSDWVVTCDDTRMDCPVAVTPMMNRNTPNTSASNAGERLGFAVSVTGVAAMRQHGSNRMARDLGIDGPIRGVQRPPQKENPPAGRTVGRPEKHQKPFQALQRSGRITAATVVARRRRSTSSWADAKTACTSHTPSSTQGPPRRTQTRRRLSPSTASTTSSNEIAIEGFASRYPPVRPTAPSTSPALTRSRITWAKNRSGTLCSADNRWVLSRSPSTARASARTVRIA